MDVVRAHHEYRRDGAAARRPRVRGAAAMELLAPTTRTSSRSSSTSSARTMRRACGPCSAATRGRAPGDPAPGDAAGRAVRLLRRRDRADGRQRSGQPAARSRGTRPLGAGSARVRPGAASRLRRRSRPCATGRSRSLGAAGRRVAFERACGDRALRRRGQRRRRRRRLAASSEAPARRAVSRSAGRPARRSATLAGRPIADGSVDARAGRRARVSRPCDAAPGPRDADSVILRASWQTFRSTLDRRPRRAARPVSSTSRPRSRARSTRSGRRRIATSWSSMASTAIRAATVSRRSAPGSRRSRRTRLEAADASAMDGSADVLVVALVHVPRSHADRIGGGRPAPPPGRPAARRPRLRPRRRLAALRGDAARVRRLESPRRPVPGRTASRSGSSTASGRSSRSRTTRAFLGGRVRRSAARRWPRA